MVDIAGNIRASSRAFPSRRNMLANREAREIENALGRQQLQMGEQTLQANALANSSADQQKDRQDAAMIYQSAIEAQNNPGTIPAFVGKLKRLGAIDESFNGNLTPQALNVIIKTAQMEMGGQNTAFAMGQIGNPNLPSDVRSNMYWNTLTPEQQESELARRRASQLIDTGAGTEAYSPIAGTTTGPVSDSATAEAMRDRQVADARAVSEAQTSGGQGGVNLTPAQRAVDTAFAQEYTEWVARGGVADVRKNLSQLANVQEQLTADGADLTGGIFQGMAPDFALAIFDPTSLAAREDVEEVVQRNLRLILGAQFTEREGERLIARAYNPRLSEAVNAQRVSRLMTSIDTAAQMKDAAAQYYEQNGTLAGWGGTLFTIDDFYDAIEGTESGESGQNRIQVDANGIPNGTRN